MVKVCAVPGQLFPPLAKVGVTVMVALIGAVPPLVAVKAGSGPLPLAPRPIAVLLLLHSYVVLPPLRSVVKVNAGTAALLQCTWSAGSSTCADGLTVIVKVCAGPVQLSPPLLKVGVTVMVALIGAVPPLVAVKAGSGPLPPAPRPIEVLLFVHA